LFLENNKFSRKGEEGRGKLSKKGEEKLEKIRYL